MGATTIWERWDGIKPDGSFQAISMNSFNHYAYGAIGDWMYKTVAGVNYDEAKPGYKQITIAPIPGGNFKNAAAKLETLYGTVKSSWKLDANQFILEVIIPENTMATIILPASANAKVTESGQPIEKLNYLKITSSNDQQKILNVGSGTYHFEYSLLK
jgi:alpha-L-rhamnosidase